MKKVCYLAILAVLVMAGVAQAAGSWTALANREGYMNGATNRPIGFVREFTADAANAAIPDLAINGVSGYITSIDVEFDGTTAPDALVVVVKSANGVTLYTSASLTASTRLVPTKPLDIAGGITAVFSTNTTNSAKAKVVFNVL